MTRASTPVEAMTAKHHLSRGVDHEWQPGCCPTERLDRLEAQSDIDDLAAIGWHLAPSMALPSSAPSRGPRTSDTAAESIDDLNDRQWAVWWALDFHGPMTDEALTEFYNHGGYTTDDTCRRSWNGRLLPKQTPQSIRSRRAELVRAGHVRDTGQTRPTKTGRQAIVWAVVGSAQEVAA